MTISQTERAEARKLAKEVLRLGDADLTQAQLDDGARFCADASPKLARAVLSLLAEGGWKSWNEDEAIKARRIIAIWVDWGDQADCGIESHQILEYKERCGWWQDFNGSPVNVKQVPPSHYVPLLPAPNEETERS